MNATHVSIAGCEPTPEEAKRKGKNSVVQSQRKRRPQIKGLVRHARILGVTRVHLRCVIIGERNSRRLTQRYQDLLSYESAAVDISKKGKTHA